MSLSDHNYNIDGFIIFLKEYNLCLLIKECGARSSEKPHAPSLQTIVSPSVFFSYFAKMSINFPAKLNMALPI